MPLSRANARDQRREPASAPAVQLYEVICHQMRTEHSLSIRTVSHGMHPIDGVCQDA